MMFIDNSDRIVGTPSGILVAQLIKHERIGLERKDWIRNSVDWTWINPSTFGQLVTSRGAPCRNLATYTESCSDPETFALQTRFDGHPHDALRRDPT